MKIANIAIHNYCSIADLNLSLEDFTVLLGPNNSGKSNVIRAVDFALSSAAKVDKGCFFEFRDEGDNELWVEVTFTDLTVQEQKTFEKYVRADSTVRIRRTATLRGDAVEIGYRGYVQQPKEWWLRSEAFAELDTLAKVAAGVRDRGIVALQPLLDEGGRVTRQRLQDFQRAYLNVMNDRISFIEELEPGPMFGTRNVASGLLPEFFLIPAVRDAEEETRSKGSSTFARLSQRAIREMSLASSGLNDLRTRVQKVVDEFNVRSTSDDHADSPLARLERVMNHT